MNVPKFVNTMAYRNREQGISTWSEFCKHYVTFVTFLIANMSPVFSIPTLCPLAWQITSLLNILGGSYPTTSGVL